jgi:hypothetical protein
MTAKADQTPIHAVISDRARVQPAATETAIGPDQRIRWLRSVLAVSMRAYANKPSGHSLERVTRDTALGHRRQPESSAIDPIRGADHLAGRVATRRPGADV